MADKRAIGVGLAAILALAAPLVVKWEGVRLNVYADPLRIPTSCYGHVGPENTPGRRFTAAECRALLEKDMASAYAAVVRCIHVPLRNNQAAALVSATYNLGPQIVCGSTLQTLVNQGAPPNVWCRQLLRWDRAGGRQMWGLTRRREAEVELCLGR